ncbi:hypothetical protein ABIE69_003069 [Rhodobacteraceae bacterium MBR-64]|jgi:hypothetical protein
MSAQEESTASPPVARPEARCPAFARQSDGWI